MESIICLMGSQDVVARIHAALLHVPYRRRAATTAPRGDVCRAPDYSGKAAGTGWGDGGGVGLS